MWAVEVTLNGLILKPISNKTGFPLLLNGTSEVLHGKGIKINDFAQISVAFEKVTKIVSKNVGRVKKIVDAVQQVWGSER